MKFFIDLARLDEIIIKTQQAFEEAVEKVAKLGRELEEQKWKLERLYAEIDREVRMNDQNANKRLTESQIKSLILLDDRYKTAMEEFLRLRSDYVLWKARKDILSSRLSAVNSLIELLKSRYYGDFVSYHELEERMKIIMEDLTAEAQESSKSHSDGVLS